jgi:hypothetical protein
MRAECQRGELAVELPGPTPAVVASHCIACQRRTGSPFAVLAYYPADHLRSSVKVGGSRERPMKAIGSSRFSALNADQRSTQRPASTHR